MATLRDRPGIEWRDWQEFPGLPELADWLRSTDAPALGVRGLPDARVQQDLHALDAIARDGAPGQDGFDMPDVDDVAAVEPEALWALGALIGGEVVVAPSGSGTRGRLDVLVRRPVSATGWRIADFGASDPASPLASRALATTPLQGHRARTLVPALDRYLRAALPVQMVPSAIVLLDALPVKANGKIDRQALPAPAHLGGAVDEAPAEPRNQVEQRLAEIWSEVLKVPQVGIHDNFFTHLGGHSLLATQLVSRVREAFGDRPAAPPALRRADHRRSRGGRGGDAHRPDRGAERRQRAAAGRDRRGHSSGRGVTRSSQIDRRRSESTPAQRALLEERLRGQRGKLAPQGIGPRQPDVAPPLSYAQERLWFLDQLSPGDTTYNCIDTLPFDFAVDVAVLERSLNEIVRRHESLRTTFREVETAYPCR